MKDKVYINPLKHLVVILTVILTLITTVLSSSLVLAEEPSTMDDDYVEPIKWLQQMFELPDKSDKSDWIVSDISVGDYYSGKYYRVKKPTSDNVTKSILTVYMLVNTTMTPYVIKYDSAQDKVIFGRYSVEFQTVDYDGVTYLEFYIPKTYDKKVCVDPDFDTIYHDYFNDTFTVKKSYTDTKVITAPANKPIEPEVPGDVTDEPVVEPDEPIVEPDEPLDEDNSIVVVQKNGFIEMVGNTTIKVFRINNVSPFNVGIITLCVLGGLVVSSIIIIIISVKKR